MWTRAKDERSGGPAVTTWFRDRREYIPVACYKTVPGFEAPETKF